MSITAAQVAELRKMTDCGMMDCKRALEEAAGDLTIATDILRKKGIAKAAKKADRVAAEGMIKIKTAAQGKFAVMLEVNCETDFVARDANFQSFAEWVADLALTHRIDEVQKLANISCGDKTVEQVRQDLIVKIGENVHVRRIALVQTTGQIGAYTHGNKIGVLVALSKEESGLAKDIAMHIAASKPLVVSPDQVDFQVITKEKEIYRAQALESGKPANIIDKMVEGRLSKFLNEVSLLGQPFVKDPTVTVGELLKKEQAIVDTFVRFELGEGIDKAKADFATEVMAQVKQST
ncbi:MAG: translation elongation factor Ts [Gammaproteobacteria bacterium GWF2_41_13]|nr:MAG: translation elongation factor Ts [Gammaproteobacteria bacterium GWF2_41_13]